MEEILWFVSRAAGLVSLLMLTGTVVLGCAHATRASTGGWQRFTLHALHRNLSLLALVFLMVHIGSAILDGYVPLQWVDAVVPFISDYHPVWLGLGAIAFDLLLAVLVTSLLRHRLSQRLWRAVHVASYAMWPIAMNGACAAAVAAAVTRRLLVRHPDTRARRRAVAGTR